MTVRQERPGGTQASQAGLTLREIVGYAARDGSLFLSLFFIAIGVYLFVLTLHFRYVGTPGAPVGPATWPRYVLGALVLTALVDVVLTLRSRIRQARLAARGGAAGSDGSAAAVSREVSFDAAVPGPRDGATEPASAAGAEESGAEAGQDAAGAPAPVARVVPHNWRTLVVGMVLVVGYGIAAIVFGFLPATFFYLLVFIIAGGFRHIFAALLIAGATSYGIVFLFTRVVYVSLPLGTGPFVAMNSSLFHLLKLF